MRCQLHDHKDCQILLAADRSSFPRGLDAMSHSFGDLQNCIFISTIDPSPVIHPILVIFEASDYPFRSHGALLLERLGHHVYARLM